MRLTIDEQYFKRLLKEAILELIEEQQGFFTELFSEVIEDAGLLEAINEGEKTKYVNRDDVFAILDADS